MAAPGNDRNASGLSRDIRLLEHLASDQAQRQGGLGVTEIAALTGRSKSVVSRALSTLAEAGLVARNPETLNYRIGPRLFALAGRGRDAELVRAGKPVLSELVRRTGETAHLCVLSHGNELTLASEISPHELRSAGWQGVTVAAWRTASGRVLLSGWDDETIRAWYDESAGKPTVVNAEIFDRESNPFKLVETARGRVHDIESLMSEVKLVRRQGYAVIDEEFEVGVVGVSAPIIDHTKRIVAAVNLSGPRSRLGDQLENVSVLVRQAARVVSQALGAPSPKR